MPTTWPYCVLRVRKSSLRPEATRNGSLRLQHFNCCDYRVWRKPAFEPSTLFGGLEQAPDEVGLADSGRAELAILDRAGADRQDLARPHADKARDYNETGIRQVLEAAIKVVLGSYAPPGRHWRIGLPLARA